MLPDFLWHVSAQLRTAGRQLRILHDNNVTQPLARCLMSSLQQETTEAVAAVCNDAWAGASYVHLGAMLQIAKCVSVSRSRRSRCMLAAVLRSDAQAAVGLYPLTFRTALLKLVRLRTMQYQSSREHRR